MNADIRISISFRGHRKRRKLRAILGPDATDYLLDLWIGAAVSRPEGILHDFSALDIALEAGWAEDPGAFVKALVEVGFIDVLEDGTYALHDWQEHQPFVVQSKARSEKARKAIHARWTKNAPAKGPRPFTAENPSILPEYSEYSPGILQEYEENTSRKADEFPENTGRILQEYSENTHRNTPYLTLPYHPNQPHITQHNKECIHSASDDAVGDEPALDGIAGVTASGGADNETIVGRTATVEGRVSPETPEDEPPAKNTTPVSRDASFSNDPPSTGNPPSTVEHAPYLTRRKRKLSGWKLEAFNEFWESFALKKGRAEAADAWLDIPELSPELARKIVNAAGKEARARPALVSKGQTPKWAQGWLSARRWEDWEYDGAPTRPQDNPPSEKENGPTKTTPSREEEEAQYRESVREALKRFL